MFCRKIFGLLLVVKIKVLNLIVKSLNLSPYSISATTPPSLSLHLYPKISFLVNLLWLPRPHPVGDASSLHSSKSIKSRCDGPGHDSRVVPTKL